MSAPPFVEVTHCRVCAGASLSEVIDLGEQPLANAFRAPDDTRPEGRYPLKLLRCEGCGLLTLSVVVAPEVMFAEYSYVTGVSAALTQHFARYAVAVADRFLPAGGRLVEIGSNDGTLLKALPGRVTALGVEPAANVAEAARAEGLDVLTAFFGAEVGATLAEERGPADVVVANNVVAHIDDLAGLAGGLKALLADEGVFVVEAPASLELHQTLAFDTLYHEHLSVLGLHPLCTWAARHGLRVFDVEEQAVHGGSLRVFFDRGRRPPSDRVQARLDRERRAGLLTATAWADFSSRVQSLLDQVRAEIAEVRDQGGQVAAYGAAAKSTVLLNAAGLGSEAIAFLCDQSPLKQGRLSPGTGIPIVPADALLSAQPALCLLCAWNLANEIATQERAYLDAGGQFLLPVPAVRRIGALER